MPPRIEKFPTEGLEGAPSRDIGWHFGDPVPNTKGNVVFKLCGKVVKGGITWFKEHIAPKIGEVAPCPNVTGIIREIMMKLLKEAKEMKMDKKRRTDEFLSQLREEEDEFVDDVSAMRQATQEKGRSSSLGSRGRYREEISEFSLRGTIPELVKSKSSRKPKSTVAKVLEEAKKVTCFIYNHIWTVDLMKKYTHGKKILRPTLTRFATDFIQLEEITRQKQEWLQEKENPLLDGENAGVLPVDTSYDEMNVDDQSQQQNLSHSSSSATPSQSGDGPNGGGLSPIDDDDKQSGDGAEFRSSNRLKCTLHHQCITRLHLTYHIDQLEITLKVNVNDLIFLVIPLIGETATTPFLRLKERHP
ncbi:hypothetical protein F3Y22_tig00112402pilonHSYRG00320 [Hibiscus syriacus]|uniref:Uncharacterized protein n=1 Tax=Hibiscus syriacus TaxID=106335 RepID=A0A6A2YAC1_HIBSY|nr:hypothetical protein F3Y22_tig00112402pilonHSYRG00320 [Hibiscus syriacus]